MLFFQNGQNTIYKMLGNGQITIICIYAKKWAICHLITNYANGQIYKLNYIHNTKESFEQKKKACKWFLCVLIMHSIMFWAQHFDFLYINYFSLWNIILKFLFICIFSNFFIIISHLYIWNYTPALRHFSYYEKNICYVISSRYTWNIDYKLMRFFIFKQIFSPKYIKTITKS